MFAYVDFLLYNIGRKGDKKYIYEVYIGYKGERTKGYRRMEG